MILDSSALVAILLREPGHEPLLDAISAAAEVGIGAPNLVEAGTSRRPT
jgi:ribonuclease VapC